MRKEKGATLEQLAFDARTDASNLSRVELGKQTPSSELLMRIAAALGTNVSTLYQITGSVEATGTALQADDYAEDAVELRCTFRVLNAENRRLTVEYVKLLYRLQESKPA
ncbi:helix-turn-helix domain-containing protein [Uliginosibacterium flavum]|uniref:Helix-turn-helix transcriptional regulator n=1 Tax=Uliginosibacterium flavum TaxID=1396831 RepID=A0ABV2TG83_9RHOO